MRYVANANLLDRFVCQHRRSLLDSSSGIAPCKLAPGAFADLADRAYRDDARRGEAIGRLRSAVSKLDRAVKQSGARRLGGTGLFRSCVCREVRMAWLTLAARCIRARRTPLE